MLPKPYRQTASATRGRNRLDRRTGSAIYRNLGGDRQDSYREQARQQFHTHSAGAIRDIGNNHVACRAARSSHHLRARRIHQEIKYLGPFRAKIAYEDVTRWLHGDDLALIRQAILRFSMPYEPDPVPAVADFHEGYGRLAQQLAPELVVKRNPNATGARPEGSTTIYFVTKKCLPRWDFLPTLRFSHQCLDSNAPSPSVKVMFDRWAIHETLLRQLSGTALGNTPLYLRRAGGSLGLVHDTPGMDQMRPVGDQIDAVSAGIRAAAALRAWMFANESTLREWAAAVDETRA